MVVGLKLKSRRWWLLPYEIIERSGFVVKFGEDVYRDLENFVLNNNDVNVLAIDAAAGYGKSLAAVKLAVDLSYDGWLTVYGFHAHSLGVKLLEYGIRHGFVRNQLVGKWW